MQSDMIKKLRTWITNSDNIIFFGGAGVSTESGIPDFRSVDGLYHLKYAYPPETILSHHFFLNHTKEFYDFYKEKMINTEATPNITHRKLAELEEIGKLKGIITQNIDGLHQRAGSKNVFELHGSVLRNYCMKCRKFYSLEDIISQSSVPKCECKGVIKPDVVLYEEGLNEHILSEAVKLMVNADVLIIGGTSLSVYPAAGLVQYYRGNKMVLINKSTTQYDKEADLLIQAGLGDIFSEL